ncbi:hypothetical protein FE391_09145 [Nonomuraea sp. KC401]|uniref:hypothetical protein n=1 Tax=unclassified Nonomuraea TaxID=2593643 RepID=UPI0010FE651C|nr:MULTISPECIES: hypothetical protein [unclassified Nonomuraea]NBE92561.1 hypothetical protein [Nonomuraea sp. K271]TLF79758.1 hypothetical protein FE391_09145 [Nonomuraea sp. KC401]
MDLMAELLDDLHAETASFETLLQVRWLAGWSREHHHDGGRGRLRSLHAPSVPARVQLHAAWHITPLAFVSAMRLHV